MDMVLLLRADTIQHASGGVHGPIDHLTAMGHFVPWDELTAPETLETSTMLGIVARTAEAIGRGLAAGLAGTAAMTVSSTLEARLRDRGDSDTPARAIETVVGADGFVSEDAKMRTNDLAHWGYGTSLGAIRGLLDGVGLGRNAADAAFHVAVLGAEQTLLPALDLAPPVTRWGGKEIASDLTHHTVYSLATNLVYRMLTPTERAA